LPLQMKKTASLKPFLLRKFATAVLVVISVAAFAMLGDGGGRKTTSSRSLLITDYTDFTHFTLRPSYLLDHNVNLNAVPNRFVLMNTEVTYQKGNATYIMPMKRKVILDKIKIGTGNIY
jgi:hypothetical protein